MSLLVDTALGQVIGGVVLDSATQEPLVQVHIGVVNKNMGIISGQ